MRYLGNHQTPGCLSGMLCTALWFLALMLAAASPVRCCRPLSSRKILQAAVCLLNRLCITHRLLGCPPMRNARCLLVVFSLLPAASQCYHGVAWHAHMHTSVAHASKYKSAKPHGACKYKSTCSACQVLSPDACSGTLHADALA